MSNALTFYEKLICKLYNYYLENPEIYKNIKLYGALDGRLYDHNVKRLVIVGEK